MVNILRVTAKWTGFSGAPGYTNFHFRDFDTGTNPDPAQASSAITKVATFFEALATVVPAAVKIDINRDVEVYDDATGVLQDIINYTGTLGQISGSATGVVAGPAGAVINWRTPVIKNGRRIRGRTFLVPLATTAYELNGTLTATAVSTITSAATTFSAGTGNPDLGVWSRPSPVTKTGGLWARATSFNVPDLVAVLRSRRD